MRITADIIDDEAIFVTNELSNHHQDQSVNTGSRNISLNDELDGYTNLSNVLINMSPFTQTVKEVTQKFKALNLSDMLPSSSHQENSTHDPFATASGEAKQGDPGDSPKAVDALPPWLTHYLTKMKLEIKEEILQEIIASSAQPKLLHVSDALHSKSGAVLKEEKISPCHVEEGGEVIHNDIYCDNCDQLIHGIRYKCGNCSDFDLCQECESLPNVHNKDHIFLKIRYPYALKLYQKQKWQELMSPLPIKPFRHGDSLNSKNQRKKLYEAKFLSDETVPDGFVIPPSTRFVKSWKVMNSGLRVWTHNTKLHLIQGSAELIPSSDQIDVPHLKPDEEGIVSVLFTSPSVPGVYRSHWNFCHKSRPFGQIVWCHIIVKPIHEVLKSAQLEASNVNELSEKVVNKQVEVSNIAQVLTAVKEEHEEDNMVPRKLIVNSHTATPNNTPFALTPPKSPDHETIRKSVREMASDKAFMGQSNDSDNEDDECSVVSLSSSSDSDTEFVVIPMPKCFNLSESFIQQHLALLNRNEGEKTKKTETEAQNVAFVKHIETVSQETGVPELSETAPKPLVKLVENYVGHSETTHVTQVNTDGSSSEISIIESENNSPMVENATQTIDLISVKISTDYTPDPDRARIEACARETAKFIRSDVREATNKEQIKDIPCNTTFPKFPVEGVTAEIFEKATLDSPEERTIQVLPEGLVFGALSAAASVYNTAKAVISTIQQPKTENTDGHYQPHLRMPLPVQNDKLPANRAESLDPMDQLLEMGFCNRIQNETLLKKHNGDVALVVAELVSLNDNEWYASRHSPPTPPGFLD